MQRNVESPVARVLKNNRRFIVSIPNTYESFPIYDQDLLSVPIFLFCREASDYKLKLANHVFKLVQTRRGIFGEDQASLFPENL